MNTRRIAGAIIIHAGTVLFAAGIQTAEHMDFDMFNMSGFVGGIVFALIGLMICFPRDTPVSE